MRRAILLILTPTMVTRTTLTDSLNRRFRFTGKGGPPVALKDRFAGTTSGSKTRTVGGGPICGFCKNSAAEIGINHVPEQDVEMSASKVLGASRTDAALGMHNRLVPFFGAGVDYSITSGIPLTAELSSLLAAKGEKGSAGIKVCEYAARSFICTLGIRLILPQSLVR